MMKKATDKSPLPMSSPISKSTTLLRNKSSNKKKSPTFSVFLSSPQQKTLSSISDLKDMVSFRIHDLKSNHIDRSHSEIVKDLEASLARFHKRFKIQSQSCQQVMDEAEKDFKKISQQINEKFEVTKESYEELMADSEASTFRDEHDQHPETRYSRRAGEDNWESHGSRILEEINKFLSSDEARDNMLNDESSKKWSKETEGEEGCSSD